MSQFRVTLLFCLMAAFFVDSNAEENKRETLDDIHAELALQLLEEEHAGLSGEELAGKLPEKRRDLNEMDREIVQQLLEEELASLSGQEVARILRQERTNSLQTRAIGCTVEGLSAKCCAGTSFKVFFKRIELNVCVEVTFSEEDTSLAIKITAAGSTLFEKKVSAGSADGICVKVPKLRVVSVCLKVSGVEISKGHFKGCLAVTPKVFSKSITSLNLGCITLP